MITFKNKKFSYWILLLSTVSLIIPAVFILQNKNQTSNVMTPEKSVEVLDCSNDEKDCEMIVIQNTIKNCGEWYGKGPGPYCENTTENLEKVTLIADAANYVKSPFTDIDYSVSIMALELQASWDLEFLPDGTALITQKDGKLINYNTTSGKLEVVAELDVIELETTGLMGLAIDPDFENNHYIYLFYTTSHNDAENKAEGISEYYVLSRISKFILRDGALTNEKILVDNIPGDKYHAGGRLEFGPDGKLYATTGDGDFPNKSQDLNDLRGKILRINTDGTVPPDNPFKNSFVYSVGYKNPQGMGWHPVSQDLFASEHGQWRYDEINLVTKDTNYGWPIKQCDDFTPYFDKTNKELKNPIMCFKDWTLAPSGMTFVDDPEHPWFGDLFVAGLRSKHLHRFEIENGEIVNDEIFFVNKVVNGMNRRLRDVEFYNGSLWVLADWSGIAKISPR